MDIINRLLVVMGLLSATAVSVVVLAAGVGVLQPTQLPMGFWLQEGLAILITPGRNERLVGVMVALAIIAGALFLLWLEWRTVRVVDRPIIVRTAPDGNVTISRSGVRRLVEQVATQCAEILEAQASVKGQHDLSVTCRACVTSGSHAPTVADEVRMRLALALETHIGRPVDRITIHTQIDPIRRRGFQVPRVL